jgi:hypothetical protein
MIYFIIVIWLYLGMYSYIYWISKHNRKYRIKWNTTDVWMIPLFGLLGPVMFVTGFMLYKQN